MKPTVRKFSGERIREARQASGLSMDRLAERLSCTRMTIYNWEMNVSAPNSALLPALADAVGVSDSFFFVPIGDGHAKG